MCDANKSSEVSFKSAMADEEKFPPCKVYINKINIQPTLSHKIKNNAGINVVKQQNARETDPKLSANCVVNVIKHGNVQLPHSKMALCRDTVPHNITNRKRKTEDSSSPRDAFNACIHESHYQDAKGATVESADPKLKMHCKVHLIALNVDDITVSNNLQCKPADIKILKNNISLLSRNEINDMELKNLALREELSASDFTLACEKYVTLSSAKLDLNGRDHVNTRRIYNIQGRKAINGLRSSINEWQREPDLQQAFNKSPLIGQARINGNLSQAFEDIDGHNNLASHNASSIASQDGELFQRSRSTDTDECRISKPRDAKGGWLDKLRTFYSAFQ